MSTDETYNGWTNRETWAFALYLNNDQGLQEWAHEITRQAAADWESRSTTRDALNGRPVPVPARWAGRALVDGFEEMAYEHADDMGSDALLRTLIDIGSTWRIDTAEIGAAFLADVAEQVQA